MKIAKIALILCVAFSGFCRLSADEPRLDWYSYGWFGTSGYYPIEYWVDVYDDTDADLGSLSVDAYYESERVWETTRGTGNGAHYSASGWCNTIDGYTDGKIYGTDGSAPYYFDVQFSY